MTEHPQVRIKVNDREALVDEELVPLITALWTADINTYMSCQDNDGYGGGGYVWLLFFDAAAAEEFLERFADLPVEDPLYQRIRGETTTHEWRYAAHLEDWAIKYGEDDDLIETKYGRSQWQFAVSVRFPHPDLKVVEDAFGVPALPSTGSRSIVNA